MSNDHLTKCKTLHQLQEGVNSNTPTLNVPWDELDRMKYMRMRMDPSCWHLGTLDLEKEKWNQGEKYEMIKWAFDNICPPLKITKWGKFLKDRQNKSFNDFIGLGYNACIYNKYLPHMHTAEIPENYKRDFGGGMCSRDLDGELFDPCQLVSEHYPKDDQLTRDIDSIYYHSAKAHWIIDSIKKEGLYQPIQGIVLPCTNIEGNYDLMIHPGSIRSLVYTEMDDPEFELTVWDYYDRVDEERVKFDDWCLYWLDILEKRNKEVKTLSFNIVGGIIEIGTDFAGLDFRREVYEFNKNITILSKKKPLNIYIGYDKTHNGIEKLSKFTIEKSIEKSWSRGKYEKAYEWTPEIKFLDVDTIPEYTRPYANQSTWFTYSRFLIPYLENYEGFSMFLDDDFFFKTSPLPMFYYLSPEDAVACIQYPQYKHDSVKFDGEVNIDYPCKLWSSMMFFNNGHEDCKKLTPEVVNTWTGAQLHQFEWTDKISKIPEKYIFVEGYDDPEEKWDFSGIHFTRGGPWIDGMDISGISNIDKYESMKNTYDNQPK